LTVVGGINEETILPMIKLRLQKRLVRANRMYGETGMEFFCERIGCNSGHKKRGLQGIIKILENEQSI